MYIHEMGKCLKISSLTDQQLVFKNYIKTDKQNLKSRNLKYLLVFAISLFLKLNYTIFQKIKIRSKKCLTVKN